MGRKSTEVKYISPRQWAKERGITMERAHQILREKGIEGAYKVGGKHWIIPEDAPDPREGVGRPVGYSPLTGYPKGHPKYEEGE